jgi:hypothetical protein
VEAYVTGVEDDEDEDDDEDVDTDECTGVLCAHCGAELMLAEEIFLLRVVQAEQTTNGVQHVDLLNDAGDYMYAPAFYCFDCGEEVLEDLRELQEDAPPVVDDAGVIECDACRSDVLLNETVAILQFGELHWSERAPNGEPTTKFVDMQNDYHICIGCLKHMEDGRDEPLWDVPLEPKPGLQVCLDGLYERCWRHGNCDCHKMTAGDEPNGN